MTFGALGSTTAGGVKGQGLLQGLWLLNIASVKAWLLEQLKAQEAHLLLYVPFFLLAGDWIYFTLKSEPSILFAAALACICATCLVLRRQNTLVFLIGIALLGFTTAKLRTEMVSTPMLRGSTSGVELAGFISNYTTKPGTARMLEVEVAEATGIPAGETPLRVRVYAPISNELQIGDFIRFKAYLSPLPRPVTPGGFDYGRMQFFSSIGAGGRMLGEAKVEQRDVPWAFEYRRIFRSLRNSISARITNVIPGPLGHLGDSMVSGERFGISDEMNTSLQISGLAHIISISGVHMTIVGGVTFWTLRAFLALFPFLALRFPIKKWAAVAGLGVCFFYTLLADSGSPTERSFIMIGVMFTAILLDRAALSLRNLAISAIIVLLITPEESFGASFQMSYLAVMGLAAFNTWYRKIRKPIQPNANLLHRLWDKFKHAAFASAGVSLSAGGASTIAAAYHFDRLSPYSVFANGFSMPISELCVMPPAMVAVLLMPFGLEYYPLKLMEFGLRFTMWISDWVASWPGANWLVAKPNVAGIVLMFAGCGILCITIGKLRRLAWPVFAAGLVLSLNSTKPDLLVEARASNVAVLDTDGTYALATKGNKFSSGKWLQGNGEAISVESASLKPAWDCNSGDCFSNLSALEVSYLRDKSGNGLYCPPTPIIIADFPLRRQCRDAVLVIDRIDVWRNGAYGVFIKNGRYTLATARGEQGVRPWTYDSRKGINPNKKTNAPPKASLVQG